MKRFIKILALCMLVVMVAMMFASCGLLGGNISKMKSRLKDKDYMVASVSSDNEIEGVVESMFNEYGFEVANEMPEKMLVAQGDDGYGDDVLVLYEFENAIKALQAYNNDYKDAIKAACDELKDEGLDPTYGISGKIIYLGTVDACKIAFGFPMNLFIKEK